MTKHQKVWGHRRPRFACASDKRVCFSTNNSTAPVVTRWRVSRQVTGHRGVAGAGASAAPSRDRRPHLLTVPSDQIYGDGQAIMITMFHEHRCLRTIRFPYIYISKKFRLSTEKSGEFVEN